MMLISSSDSDQCRGLSLLLTKVRWLLFIICRHLRDRRRLTPAIAQTVNIVAGAIGTDELYVLQRDLLGFTKRIDRARTGIMLNSARLSRFLMVRSILSKVG